MMIKKLMYLRYYQSNPSRCLFQLTFLSLFLQSWPLCPFLSDRICTQKLALNILVCRSPSGCNSATHPVRLSGSHESVGAGHNVRLICLARHPPFAVLFPCHMCQVSDLLRSWMQFPLYFSSHTLVTARRVCAASQCPTSLLIWETYLSAKDSLCNSPCREIRSRYVFSSIFPQCLKKKEQNQAAHS